MANRWIWTLLLTLATLAAGTLGRTDRALLFYVGIAWAPDTDLHLDAPDGTSLTYHDLSWRTESFTTPLYYGVRLIRWLPGRPNAGVAIDFTHAKLYLEPGPARVTGVRGGKPVDRTEPVADTLDGFANSHGLNLLTVNGVYRWNAGARAAPGWLRLLRPYAALGGGAAAPHVEATIGGSPTGAYQLTGPVVQALAGLAVSVGLRWGVFGEYKFNHSRLDEELAGGERVRLNLPLHQLVVGFGFGL